MLSRNGSGYISVITPIKNYEKGIHKIEYCINQLPEKNFELILIHDCDDLKSSIELSKLLDMNSIPSVKLIQGQFGNPGSARNAGLRIANGNWITFWDSDDLPEVNRYLQMADLGSLYNYECVIGGFTVVDDASLKADREFLFGINPLLDIYSNPGIWRFIFERKSISEISFRDFRMAEDQLFIAEYDLPNRKIGYFEESVYKYFVGNTNHATSQKIPISDLPKVTQIIKKLLMKSHVSSRQMLATFLVKQVFTAVRRGSILTKIYSMFLFAYYIIILPIKIKFRIIAIFSSFLLSRDSSYK